MDRDGSRQHNLSNSPGLDFSPNWSPDGNRIAEVTNLTQRPAIDGGLA